MQKRILFTVLDWGLGHATRSIPVIRALLQRECEVIIASDSLAFKLLTSEFPSLKAYELTPYGITYSSGKLILNAVRNSQNVRRAIAREHEEIKQIAAIEKVSAVVSDNRYGSYVDNVPNVMITHQLQFRTGNVLVDSAGKVIVYKLLSHFDRIWVPDNENSSLSGDLSTSSDTRLRKIGWLSTLGPDNLKPVYDLAIILSGPEPQRTMLESHITEQLKENDVRCVLVRGVAGSQEAREEGNMTVYDFLDRSAIHNVMHSSPIILCRSGYSSLMDLKVAGKKGILIPTPGQPEQEYLGERLGKEQYFVVQNQDELNISEALETLSIVDAPAPSKSSSTLLKSAIDDLFELM